MILCQAYHHAGYLTLSCRAHPVDRRPNAEHERERQQQEKKLAYLSARNSRWIVFHLRHFLISTLYFISRHQITNPKYIISYPDSHQHGLIGTAIGLNTRISSQYFEDGVLRVKCVASISPIIWSANRETVIQQQGLQQFDIPLPSIDTREVLFLGRCTCVNHSEPQRVRRKCVDSLPSLNSLKPKTVEMLQASAWNPLLMLSFVSFAVKSSAITINSVTLLLSANILLVYFAYRHIEVMGNAETVLLWS